MQEIIFRQHRAARPMTGRAFVLGIAGILIQLAAAQIVIELLVSVTGAGLLRIALYLLAVLLLAGFMRDMVSGCVYTLGENTLVLERRLGDSTRETVEIPIDRVASLRPVRMAENLRISYRNVIHIDSASRPPVRVRAAFAASLVSSKLSRLLAGKHAQDVIGHVIVFDEENLRRACTFCPNEEMLEHLRAAVRERHGFDERMTRAKISTLYARALERAFPALYPFVDPLLKYEDVEWAREEIERQKAARREKKSGKQPEEKQETPQAQEAKETNVQADGAQPTAQRRRRKQG